MPLMGGLCTVRNSLRSSSCPSAPAGESYGGLHPHHHPRLTLAVQKAPGKRKSSSCVPKGGSGACGAEGAVPGQGCRAPLAPLLQPAGQGASLASAALSAGWAGMFTTSYGRTAGLPLTVNVSELFWAVPQAANRPCPPGTGVCRRRLLFPALPLAFPALPRRCHTPASAHSHCPGAPPPSW